MSDCKDCDNMERMKNPFAGKPAYVSGTEPCPKVCRPCAMQSHIAPHIEAQEDPSPEAVIEPVPDPPPP